MEYHKLRDMRQPEWQQDDYKWMDFLIKSRIIQLKLELTEVIDDTRRQEVIQQLSDIEGLQIAA